MLERRDGTSSDYLEIAARLIRKRLYVEREFGMASKIGAYYSVGSEVPTMQIIQDVLRDRGEAYLPVVTGARTMEFGRITSLAGLRSGIHGVPEPRYFTAGTCPDVVIVPAVGVAPDGSRLGYGLGYYDAFLGTHKTGTTIATVLEKQIVKKIPADEHDIRIDMIITEKRTIRASR